VLKIERIEIFSTEFADGVWVSAVEKRLTALDYGLACRSTAGK